VATFTIKIVGPSIGIGSTSLTNCRPIHTKHWKLLKKLWAHPMQSAELLRIIVGTYNNISSIFQCIRKTGIYLMYLLHLKSSYYILMVLMAT
jgi:hypothetical protein